MLPTVVMEKNPNTPRLLHSRSVIKLASNRFLTADEGDPCTFQPPYNVPKKHRILPVRAEDGYGRIKASSSMPETERSSRSTFRDADEADIVSVWDSNAEGIRGSWQARKTYSYGSRPAEDPHDTEASDREDSWQWWRSGPDDDDYEGDGDDDDDDSWFRFGNFDVLSVASMLRWMVPAAALFLPWLFGGPMFLMMAFAVFPLVQKLLGFFMPSSWKEGLQDRYASSKSRQKEGSFWRQPKYNSFMDSREESDFFDMDVEDWETSLLRNSMKRESKSNLGGWGEENDKVSIQKSVRRGKKKAALQRRWSKKEVPLFFRLLVALFPFLRSWGGFL